MERGIVLPVPGQKNILVTSALAHVNNVPHLVSIIGSVLSADVFARYCRSRGLNTLFVGGTDEHGTAAEVRALVENRTPEELCGEYHRVHADVYEWFNISFDVFGRTTTQTQTQITHDIFLKLNNNGFLDERTSTQLYCEEHESFLADRFVQGHCPACGYLEAQGDQCESCGQLLDALDLEQPRCNIDGSVPVVRDTNHIFLELDKLQSQVKTFYAESAKSGGWSSNSRRIASDWLEKGLQPRKITRNRGWGTEVPISGHEDSVICSQLDACIGYVSITAQYTDEWERWWRNPENVRLYQFIGKDDILHPSILFPASQIGTGDVWTRLHHLSAGEFLTYKGDKFSKPRGTGVFADSAQETGVPADAWRYFLLSYRPENVHADFTWDSFVTANNSILVNKLGNLVSRVLKFVNSRYEENKVPDWTEYHEPSFDLFKDDVNEQLVRYNKELGAVKIRAGLSTVLKMVRRGNTFLESNRLNNSLADNNPAKCAAVLGLAVNLVHLLVIVISPYMPTVAEAINSQLLLDAYPIPDRWAADSVRPGHQIGTSEHLLDRISPEKADEWETEFDSRTP